ncbi:hypothetical protein EVAR_17305_1 [Eumeta japonica]|uniref:Uncharacterized protein n=1 Tax=Eumeta variegata TaxID=151549 RepID=A0A4C1TTP8_EUMVA|nr:hypothetical protein EVAR_17305_1 [Eumeta japonica]
MESRTRLRRRSERRDLRVERKAMFYLPEARFALGGRTSPRKCRRSQLASRGAHYTVWPKIAITFVPPSLAISNPHRTNVKDLNSKTFENEKIVEVYPPAVGWHPGTTSALNVWSCPLPLTSFHLPDPLFIHLSYSLPRAGNALVTLLGLRMCLGGSDYIVSDGLSARLPLDL